MRGAGRLLAARALGAGVADRVTLGQTIVSRLERDPAHPLSCTTTKVTLQIHRPSNRCARAEGMSRRLTLPASLLPSRRGGKAQRRDAGRADPVGARGSRARSSLGFASAPGRLGPGAGSGARPPLPPRRNPRRSGARPGSRLLVDATAAAREGGHPGATRESPRSSRRPRPETPDRLIEAGARLNPIPGSPREPGHSESWAKSRSTSEGAARPPERL